MTDTRATQAEIAQRTGVCQATVSLVLAKRETSAISVETRDRILRVAEEIGYSRPQKKPRKRNAIKTHYIGFLIRQDRDLDEVQNNLRRFQMGMLDSLRGDDYYLVVDTIVPDEPLPSVIRDHRVDGVIIEDYCEDETILRYQEQVPCVLLNFTNDSLPVDSVMPDNIGGVSMAINQLAEMGHQRIAIFGSEPKFFHFKERLTGYHAALMTLGFPIRSEYVAMLEPQRLHDQEEMDDFAMATLQRWLSLPEPPTAIQAVSDNYVPFLVRAARALGLSIPEHMSLFGFDNLPVCNDTDPPLSSVEQPMEEMGRMAGRLLLDRIGGAQYSPRRLRVNASLVMRESAIAVTS